MSNKKIVIACHDCGLETIIQDKYDEIDPDNIRFCPYCGSDNIEIG